jgi:glutamine---fructose-6-phosphate transaminase (isomerizing)
MLKEIHEQPQAVQDTFAGRVDFESGAIAFDTLGIARRERRARRNLALHVLACGTSWHAALVGKFLIEELARLPVEVDYGSEYRYRDPIVDDRRCWLSASRSRGRRRHAGRWRPRRSAARLLAHLQRARLARRRGSPTGPIYTHAGPEIGVASTKAFTTQLVALYLLALYLRQQQRRSEPSRAPRRARPPAAGDRGGARARARDRGDRPRYHRPATSSSSAAASTTRSRSRGRSSSRRSPTSTPRATRPAR